MRFDGVTFDAFGTVFDTGRSAVFEVAADVVARERLPVSADSFLAVWDAAFFGLQRDARSPEGRFLTLAGASERSLASALALHGSSGDARPYVSELLSRWSRARPFPDVRAALEGLGNAPMAIVSNADDAFLRDLVRRSGVHIDVIVTSEAARSYKPDPGIFDVALRALGTRARRTLHVGDSYGEDVAGAKAAGMAAAWLNRKGAPRPERGPKADFEIADLMAVPRILATWRRNR